MSIEEAALAQDGAVLGFDHVALPMMNTEVMIAFYRSLGLPVAENRYLVQVYLGDQMINFHRPEVWQGDVSLRAAAASPPCGDLCLVWEGSQDSLIDLLGRAKVEIIEGQVERQGGRRVVASSVYVRDPDGNLIEFITYPDDPARRRL
ncbi:MAG TPA: VOC family protein [Acidimicrobiales bacterium]|jgi:catechol 2,3-dioxygenase-like lactoylglutathione lyase family enzyme|nr:VOC family protein [Acidimicrobiales bacterium]